VNAAEYPLTPLLANQSISVTNDLQSVSTAAAQSTIARANRPTLQTSQWTIGRVPIHGTAECEQENVIRHWGYGSQRRHFMVDSYRNYWEYVTSKHMCNIKEVPCRGDRVYLHTAGQFNPLLSVSCCSRPMCDGHPMAHQRICTGPLPRSSLNTWQLSSGGPHSLGAVVGLA
jgi:hypothetical protein